MEVGYQEVQLGCGFVMPVSLTKLGHSQVADQPLAIIFVALLSFFVTLAILALPFSSLFDLKLFPGFLPHGRSVLRSVLFYYFYVRKYDVHDLYFLEVFLHGFQFPENLTLPTSMVT